MTHRLSKEDRKMILLTYKEPEFATLTPGQMLLILGDRELYIGSERSFYRVLHAHGRIYRRRRARPPQESRPLRQLRAAGLNEEWI